MPRVDFFVSGKPTALELADFDDDGDLDALTNDTVDNGFRIALGDGAGNFAPSRVFPSAAEPSVVRLVDINGDGAKDVVMGHKASAKLAVYQNLCPFCGDGVANEAEQALCPEDVPADPDAGGAEGAGGADGAGGAGLGGAAGGAGGSD